MDSKTYLKFLIVGLLCLLSIFLILNYKKISIRATVYYRILVKKIGEKTVKNTKYSKIVFLDEIILSPIKIKILENNPNFMFIGELEGRIIKLDIENNTKDNTEIIDLTKLVSMVPIEGGLYDFDFHPSENIIAISYSMEDSTKKYNSKHIYSLVDFSGVQINKERILLELFCDLHVGGSLLFDSHGNLFLGTGDGDDGDPKKRSQNLNSHYGKILKYHVSNIDSINTPRDNPFVNNNKGLKEIFSYGLRNPFRFCFNEEKKELIVADVGDAFYEEINKVKPGDNLGWNIKEGSVYYSGDKTHSELVDPFYEYKHGMDGFSVIGGIIYTGNKFINLKGKYIFGDYITGRIWALNLDSINEKPELLLVNGGTITSFAEDKNGNIYWSDLRSQRIMKLGSIAD